MQSDLHEQAALKNTCSVILQEKFNSKLTPSKKRTLFRVQVMVEVVTLLKQGFELKKAFVTVARANSMSVHTLKNWYFGAGGKKGIRGIEQENWSACLMDRRQGCLVKAECSAVAWDFFKKNYLCKERLPFSVCYRLLEEKAQEQGWAIPSESTLRRRIFAEFSKVAINAIRRDESVLSNFR